jgi:hypothetical protein
VADGQPDSDEHNQRCCQSAPWAGADVALARHCSCG